jgi:response regulator RpfG family c-di-GMP phosphodiesterase
VLAITVARGLGLTYEEIGAIEQLVLLHDIGKICVHDDILQKAGALDDAEWQTLRSHPTIGAQIVASVEELAHLAPAIRAEHECWDGTGYPVGLAGDQIPVISRIVVACDALRAMTSERPYRTAMTTAVALRVLRARAGTQFDPVVIDALLDVVAADNALSPTNGDAAPLVLVVEGDVALRSALKHSLSREGLHVRLAATATDAYRTLCESCFDVILLNWIPRGGDGGPDVCRRLRYLHPAGKIVVLTGFGDPRDLRAAMDAGATAVLQEGIELEALAELLREIAKAI